VVSKIQSVHFNTQPYVHGPFMSMCETEMVSEQVSNGLEHKELPNRLTLTREQADSRLQFPCRNWSECGGV